MNDTTVCILSAGVGSRLGDLTAQCPKTMLKVGGVSILERQISAISQSGIPQEAIRVVTGHAAGVIRDFLNGRIEVVHNDKYASANNIYSVHLMRQLGSNDIVLINGDTLFHPDILAALLASDAEASLAIDDRKVLDREEMKANFESGKLRQIGKELDPTSSTGEYIGLCRFQDRALKVYLDEIGRMVTDGETDVWYENAMNGIVDEVEIGMSSTQGLPWIEIDTPEDLRSAIAVANSIPLGGSS